MSKLIVVTGPLGSGKTELARTLTRHRDYKALNIGDLLAEQLVHVGALPTDRTDIGATYLAQFGVVSYQRTVESAAGLGVVLDGLRLPSALRMLRQTWPDLIHLARPGVVREGVGEPFASHIGDLEAVADALVTWQPSVADLPQAVDRALKELAVRA